MYISDQARSEIEILLDGIARASSRIQALLGDHDSQGGQPAGVDDATNAAGSIDFSVVDAQPLTPRSFTYRWPTGEAKYVDAIRYTVRCDDNEYVFVVGAEEGGRAAYRRADRGRVVVFLRQTTSANSYYPLLEFAESDLDANLYAALIPKPGQKSARATVDDLDAVRGVAHLHKADIRRADQVFDSSANAPTLRVLVRRDDHNMLIAHSWWVGRLRRTAP
ncbi:hypothetical protein [Micromonospora avicenniae]|uniref:Uncharacterized protein n=1 Tax=Micromonospora avicenniae TaxID=1198245 RepID=A0A1N7EQI6_9ACTN|nr:hypothetical protein [Micromonospora avicenniae]SIR90368.1 hypothetical protein SAMN05444858_12625 [Micromonospora avicenniae]